MLTLEKFWRDPACDFKPLLYPPPFQGPTFPIIGAGVHKKGLSKPIRRAALAQGMAVCLFVC